MAVHINESRRNNEAVAVDDISVVRSFDRATSGSDLTVGEEKVADFVEVLRWIEESSSTQQHRLILYPRVPGRRHLSTWPLLPIPAFRLRAGTKPPCQPLRHL